MFKPANQEPTSGSNGSLAKQSLVQSSLYIASFFICLQLTSSWTWCISIFWPLGGFFNILIYTRPKVARYKDSNPEYLRLYVFLIVVLSGGEVPTEVDNQNNDFISERERVLNSIPRKICGFRRYGKDFRKLHDAKNANEDSTPLQMPALDSMPTARVKSHDS